MKRMDFFCTSQASTAICSNADQHSNNPPTHHHHQPTSPHLRHDPPRKIRTSVPCSSQLPITPRRSTSNYTQISVPCSSHLPNTPRRSTSNYTQISVPCSSQLPITPRRSSYTKRNHNSSSKELLINDRRRKSSADITDVSSRQLSSDAPFFELLSNSDRIKPPRITTTRSLSTSSSHHGAPRPLKSFLLSPDNGKPLAFTPKITTAQRLSISSSVHDSHHPLKSSSLSTHESIKLASVPKITTSQRLSISPPEHDSPRPLQSSLSTPRPCRDQVVELRVSLHCKGCEGKVRKHISRMEGVKTFNIDFANKKVTIIGDVIPLEVLASVSKVKNAQFWPPTSSSSSSSSSSFSSLFSGQDQPDLLL